MTKTVKDLPQPPKEFLITNFLNLTFVLTYIISFGYNFRSKLNRLAIKLHTYRKLMAIGDSPGPTAIRIFNSLVVLCGQAAIDFLKSEEDWTIEKVSKVGQLFNALRLFIVYILLLFVYFYHY